MVSQSWHWTMASVTHTSWNWAAGTYMQTDAKQQTGRVCKNALKSFSDCMKAFSSSQNRRWCIFWHIKMWLNLPGRCHQPLLCLSTGRVWPSLLVWCAPSLPPQGSADEQRWYPTPDVWLPDMRPVFRVHAAGAAEYHTGFQPQVSPPVAFDSVIDQTLPSCCC